MSDKLLKVGEASSYFGCSQQTLRNWIFLKNTNQKMFSSFQTDMLQSTSLSVPHYFFLLQG